MAKSSIIEREHEQRVLSSAVRSNKAELVALYGRRRVGKTYLVRNHLQPQAGTFLEITGAKRERATIQRRRFREAVQSAFVDGKLLPDFSSWEQGFSYLAEVVAQRARARPKEKIVLFFDELPWLATPKSRLLESLDYYWNHRLSRIKQLTVVLCGSAASWMLRRVVDAKGGLHNRITRRLRLEPFSLQETESFLRQQRVRLKEKELMELYMAIGGVPYYLSLVERGRSVPQIVGQLCFERAGPLKTEFDKVFASLFDEHEDHVAIVRALAKKVGGLTRNELIAATGLGSGGSLNRRLRELEESGFIARMEPFRHKAKNTLYRVIDEYTLFYLRWIERTPRGVLARGGANRWLSMRQTAEYRAWTGYAFESLCLKHALELQAALGIENVATDVATWRYVPKKRKPTKQGVQVDLLFDRRDGVINLCELKFATEPFVVTKAYAAELKKKVQLFEETARIRKRVVLTLVAPIGLKKNVWSEDLVDQVLDASAFFSRR